MSLEQSPSLKWPSRAAASDGCVYSVEGLLFGSLAAQLPIALGIVLSFRSAFNWTRACASDKVVQLIALRQKSKWLRENVLALYVIYFFGR
jgi:hypothetical protein